MSFLYSCLLGFPQCSVITSRCACAEPHADVRQDLDEDVDHVGIESIYVKPCHSKKFSFVKAATENGITKELMYIYEPMGLDRQADQMGCLLARFQCRNLAACFLWILQTKLDMKLMEVFVTHGTSCSISKP